MEPRTPMKKSILIIDDDEDDHFFMREALIEAGLDVNVYSAISGKLALGLLEQLRGNLPALVILDLNMPEMSGMEILLKIRGKYDMPILMHTTTCTDDLIKEAKLKGAFDCIQKSSTRSGNVKTAKMIQRMMN
jgi:CheY-like chemotaxis protein